MPKAILLDMDDTILSYDHGVDTDSCWRRSFGSNPGCDPEDLLAEIKAAARWYWSDPERHRIGRLDLYKARQDIVGMAMKKLDVENAPLVDTIAHTYGEERDKCVALFPDSIATIQALRQKGIKLALLTNGNAKPQWAKIHRFELAPLFDCVLVEGEFGIGKPDERIYLHALERLEVTAEEAWMVGDNFEWEVAAPQRLGIRGIWLDHKGAGVPAGATAVPHRILKSLGELLTMV
ncbi:HAD family hydrolase [Paenibacillus vulneris]|uniref:HAD family hydrolase n=1 Tax=Paenibacillus vulneris TaxID=1133364 RepID=A0ABW3UYC8_9BACL|nr:MULTISPECIES: HAD family hydrolase [unclassified Paenibacillus]MBE1442278.1 putative hydrolase of the HAD superfamily [Paenibacillus sp. OAS669]